MKNLLEFKKVTITDDFQSKNNRRLYIIGNGFDLHHGLETSYYHFAEYLKQKDSELYELLERYIGYPETEEDLWSMFEENLANLDVDAILDDNSYSLPNIASDDFRSRDMHIFPDTMDQYYSKLTEELIVIFEDFIRQVKKTDSIYNHSLELDVNSLFLTFNYTNVLETYYKIGHENIAYIHNSAHYGPSTNYLILGHGVDPENYKEDVPTPPKGLSEEELERWHQENDNWDYSYDTGKESLLKYFEQNFKNTKRIIEEKASLFNSLSGIYEVFVLGHSLSNVDIPYFKEIVKNTSKDTKWNISYYSDYEIKKHRETLVLLGIKVENITHFLLTDIEVNNNQLSLELTD